LYYQAARREFSFIEDLVETDQPIMRPQSIDYKLINVVAMGVLNIGGTSLDLAKLEPVTQVKYLNRFPCAMFKVVGISVLLFKNGKMIITGLKDPMEIPPVKSGIEEILEQAGYQYDSFEISIQNLVAMLELGHRIDLEMTCLTMENCMYEPEQFPAAVFKNYHQRGGSLLVFANGKIISLGINDIDQLQVQFEAIVDELFDIELVKD
jgi:transcription initiation factor TFIID TATA-box-binding protein